jgi:hypothetical protein
MILEFGYLSISTSLNLDLFLFPQYPLLSPPPRGRFTPEVNVPLVQRGDHKIHFRKWKKSVPLALFEPIFN